MVRSGAGSFESGGDAEVSGDLAFGWVVQSVVDRLAACDARDANRAGELGHVEFSAGHGDLGANAKRFLPAGLWCGYHGVVYTWHCQVFV